MLMVHYFSFLDFIKPNMITHDPHCKSLPSSGIKELSILNCLLQFGQVIIMLRYIPDFNQISFNFGFFIH